MKETIAVKSLTMLPLTMVPNMFKIDSQENFEISLKIL